MQEAVQDRRGAGHVRVEQIGLAKSSDGIHWKRSPKPVMKIGASDSIDSIQATGMHVLKKGDEYWMWYGAYNGNHTIGLATSTDGVHWAKANGGQPVQGLEGPAQLGPSVYFDGRQFFMLYNHGSQGGWDMFAATSADGTSLASDLQSFPLVAGATRAAG